MAILHMEVETARNAQAKIMSTQQEVTTQIQSMSSVMGAFQPTWLGSAASQFFQEYEQWNSAMASFLEELRKLGTNLEREITEWENTAATS